MSTSREDVVRLLMDAERVFLNRLKESKNIEHFLTVNDPVAPFRRMDEGVITVPRRKFIGSRFQWNITEYRWQILGGGKIIAEHEIWSFLSTRIGREGIPSENALWNQLKETTEGLVRQDLSSIFELWSYFGLNDVGSGFRNEDWTAVIEEVNRNSSRAEVRAVDEELLSGGSSSLSNPAIDDPAAAANVGGEIDAGEADDLSQTVQNVFHPHARYSNFLSVGTSGVDNATVWFAWRPAPWAQKPGPIFYNDDLEPKSRQELQIEWHDHLQLANFEGTPAEQGKRRTERCRRIVQDHETQVAAQAAAQAAARKRPARVPKLGRKRGAASKQSASSRAKGKGKGKEVVPTQEGSAAMPEPPTRKRRAEDVDPTPSTGGPMTRKRAKADAQTSVYPETQSNANVETQPPPAKNQRTLQDHPTGHAPAAAGPSNGPQVFDVTTSNTSNEPGEIPTDPALIHPEHLPLPQISQTVLLVTASNRTDLAPISVPFRRCQTLDAFFTTMIAECELSDDVSVTRASVTYTWNQKRRLVRIHRGEDWTLFYGAVQKAWEREEELFVEDGCEVEVMVHVE